MNRDVADLPQLLEDKVGSSTRYACSYWAMHLRLSPTTNDYTTRLIPSAIEFFEKNALPWIEVMSLENRLESVIHSIYSLFDWLGMVCKLHCSRHGSLTSSKQVNVSVSNLRNLAEDCLRFVINFFHPIRQSASHIYHSAIPLSPRSSAFHSMTSPKKTMIRGFDGQSDTWGIIVQTITADVKHFTHMLTFGHKIAATCDGGTVAIYDSVTGALRLSLDLVDPVQAVGGSPDGSLLFCAHKTPSMTVWDIQTGGLVHTLDLGRNAEETAVSLKGGYLACRMDDGSVKVWEVVNNMEGAAIWTGSQVTHLCWLEPEEQLAISTGASVRIYDIVTGTVLHNHTVRYPVNSMVYSQKLKQLAILASSASESALTVVNHQTGIFATSLRIDQKFTCLAFSQTTEELVCGMETHGLGLFNISTRQLKHIEYPDKVTSISSLQNWTIVAGVAVSGIQLLSLEEGNTPPRQPAISALTVEAFDQDRIIAILLTSRDRILLLEQVTMSQLLEIPIRNVHLTPTDHATIFCVSHKNLMAVYCFKEGDTGFLQLWRFHEEVPRWTVQVDGVPEMGRLSPTAVRLITLDTLDGISRLRVWSTLNGQLEEQPEYIPPPLDIEFTSDTEFHSHYTAYRTSYTFRPWGLHLYNKEVSPTQSKKKQHLQVDDAHEWVIRGSKRVCWIPPQYIGSTQPGYCWIGDSLLVMAGKDGMLRKLTFSYDHFEA